MQHPKRLERTQATGFAEGNLWYNAWRSWTVAKEWKVPCGREAKPVAGPGLNVNLQQLISATPSDWTICGYLSNLSMEFHLEPALFRIWAWHFHKKAFFRDVEQGPSEPVLMVSEDTQIFIQHTSTVRNGDRWSDGSDAAKKGWRLGLFSFVLVLVAWSRTWNANKIGLRATSVWVPEHSNARLLDLDVTDIVFTVKDCKANGKHSWELHNSPLCLICATQTVTSGTDLKKTWLSRHG